MDRSDLANRMKEYYEQVPKTRLMRRCPVIIRCDGRSFHTFTRGFKRPFDEVLIQTMQETTKYLCENIQGCVLGYTQSDEISLVLVDYQRFETSAWFDYEVQKMCSIAASMATMAFNKILKDTIDMIILAVTHYGEDDDYEMASKILDLHTEVLKSDEFWDVINVYEKAIEKGAMFDARVFNIPKEEVTNYVYWRQLDASRNSIQMVGQANFSHNELQNKSCNDIQDMLMTQKSINWNDFPTYQKRGSCVVKEYYVEENPNEKGDNTEIERSRWVIDNDIPIFKGEGREYIDRLIMIGE